MCKIHSHKEYTRPLTHLGLVSFLEKNVFNLQRRAEIVNSREFSRHQKSREKVKELPIVFFNEEGVIFQEVVKQKIQGYIIRFQISRKKFKGDRDLIMCQAREIKGLSN